MSSPDMIAKSDAHALVLASGSEVRTRLLTSAGVPHIVDPSDVDEASVRDKMLVENATHVSIAEALAKLKAHRVSAKHEGCIVIGADQVLSCDGALFEKPADLDGVRAHLKRLMGKEHTLHASVCAVLDGDVIWHVNADAVLHMRELSDSFMDYYIETVGEAACQSVGAYLLEGLGIQLFSSIDDDFFTILGLPMLPLLEFLRSNNVIER